MMDVTMVVCINEAVIVLGVDKLVLDNKIVVPDLMQLNDTCLVCCWPCYTTLVPGAVQSLARSDYCGHKHRGR